MDVSVIIINWNSKDCLRVCLKSLAMADDDISMEVIVVDNASHDGCAAMLEQEFPHVIFIQSQDNLGFAKGNNYCAKRATGRTLLFLNPDTELLENSIPILAARLNSLPQAGAVGCKLLNSDKTLQRSCIQSFPGVANQFLDSDYLRDRFPKSSLWGTAAFLADGVHPHIVQAVSGACFMIRRDVFDQVGGWTEDYFMYGEDLDLSYKIRQAGYYVYYVPETSIIHYGGNSSQKAQSCFSNVMTRESVYKFMRLRRGRVNACCYRLAMAAASVIRLLLLLPFRLCRGRAVQPGADATQKWYSILRWSLGLERWARDGKGTISRV